MSEQQDTLSPLDSASNISGKKGKKNRPGKAQREAARSNISQASANTGTASLTGAQQFASKMSFTPVPQPGRFPIVFPSGAGEPTRDAEVAIDGCMLKKSLSDLPDGYINSARYAEFSQNSALTDDEFSKEILVSSLLGIAQQIVHAHQNMELPIGDFSSVSSTDVYNPMAIRAIIHQFGEFSVESLGTRFLFKSYVDEVTALVRTAQRVASQPARQHQKTMLGIHWLPTRIGDVRTSFIVAAKLKQYLEGYGLSIPSDVLSNGMFVKAPAIWQIAKQVLPDDERDIFDVLFTEYKDAAGFTKMMDASDGLIPSKLGLPWYKGAAPLFGVIPKTKFPELLEPWLRKKATFMKFFSCGSGSAEKSAASGSVGQLSSVETVSGVTVVRGQVAVSAPEYSLLTCFPSTLVYPESVPKNVVLTTSVNARVRAIEFLQLDWL